MMSLEWTLVYLAVLACPKCWKVETSKGTYGKGSELRITILHFSFLHFFSYVLAFHCGQEIAGTDDVCFSFFEMLLY